MRTYYLFTGVTLTLLMVALNVIFLTQCDLSGLDWLGIAMITTLDISAVFAVWLCLSEFTNYKNK